MDHLFDFVSIGEPLVGLYPVPGEPELSRVIYGGDTSNVALAAARLGLRSAFAGAVGDDPYGSGFMRLWEEREVDSSLVVTDADRFTGLYVISFDEGTHRFAYYRKGSAASAYTPTPGMRRAITSARVVHVSGITQAISTHMTDVVFELMGEARSNGALVSYDVNYRSPLWPADRAAAVVQATIERYADIVSLNTDEVHTLGLARSAEEFAEKCLSSVQMVAVRNGEQGAEVFTASGARRAPAFSVDVADTVGAGDAFDAGLIAAYLRGLSPKESLEYANAVAALTCRETGSTKGHPTTEEVESLLSRG